jgi:chromosome segregation ATPase
VGTVLTYWPRVLHDRAYRRKAIKTLTKDLDRCGQELRGLYALVADAARSQMPDSPIVKSFSTDLGDIERRVGENETEKAAVDAEMKQIEQDLKEMADVSARIRRTIQRLDKELKAPPGGPQSADTALKRGQALKDRQEGEGRLRELANHRAGLEARRRTLNGDWVEFSAALATGARAAESSLVQLGFEIRSDEELSRHFSDETVLIDDARQRYAHLEAQIGLFKKDLEQYDTDKTLKSVLVLLGGLPLFPFLHLPAIFFAVRNFLTFRAQPVWLPGVKLLGVVALLVLSLLSAYYAGSDANRLARHAA